MLEITFYKNHPLTVYRRYIFKSQVFVTVYKDTLIFVLFYYFRQKFSLCSPGWPQAHDFSALISCMLLKLHVCVTLYL